MTGSDSSTDLGSTLTIIDRVHYNSPTKPMLQKPELAFLKQP